MWIHTQDVRFWAIFLLFPTISAAGFVGQLWECKTCFAVVFATLRSLRQHCQHVDYQTNLPTRLYDLSVIRCNSDAPKKKSKKPGQTLNIPSFNPWYNAKCPRWFTAKCSSCPCGVFWNGAPSIPALKIKASKFEVARLRTQVATERRSESSQGAAEVSNLASGKRSVMSWFCSGFVSGILLPSLRDLN